MVALLLRSRRTAAVTSLALALCAISCGRPEPTSQHNLLIVSFDTLRADRLGSYGNDTYGETISPHADELAADGVLFEHCLAPRGQTHPSLASLLTGKFPITTGVRENVHTLAPDQTTLFEFLQGAGFQTGIFLANFSVNPEAVSDNWAFRGAETASDGFAGRRRAESQNESAYQSVWDDRTEAAALGWLDQVDTSRPFAGWVHFYDIHKPYNPPPGYIGRWGSPPEDLPKYLRDPGPNSGLNLERYLAGITLTDRPVSAAELAAVLALYDSTVTATDARLGRLLDKLDELGERDSTYVIFTSDHGEELFDHNRYFFHGASIYAGTVRIPMIVSGPGLPAGRRAGAQIQNLDVAPTVLELLGLPIPADMEGGSLAGLLAGTTEAPPRPHAFVEWQDRIYVISDGRHVYVDNRFHTWPKKSPYASVRPDTLIGDAPPGFRIACFEAYDLQVDPLEQHDLLAELDPEAVADGSALTPELSALKDALMAWLREPRHERQMNVDTPVEQLEHLRQLGYLGGDRDRADVYDAGPCLPSR